jgi:hypothetical protein
MMRHRHLSLTPEIEFILPAIDDIICYGMWLDWAELREAAIREQSVRDDIIHLSRRYMQGYNAQRYRFWFEYVQRLNTLSQL